MRTRKLDVIIRNEIKMLNSRSKQATKEIKQWENDTMFSSEFIADSISILNNELDSISKKLNYYQAINHCIQRLEVFYQDYI